MQFCCTICGSSKFYYTNYSETEDSHHGVRCASCHKALSCEDLSISKEVILLINENIRKEHAQHVSTPNLKKLFKRNGNRQQMNNNDCDESKKHINL